MNNAPLLWNYLTHSLVLTSHSSMYYYTTTPHFTTSLTRSHFTQFVFEALLLRQFLLFLCSSCSATECAMAEENEFDTLLDALKGETILVQPRVSREVLTHSLTHCFTHCFTHSHSLSLTLTHCFTMIRCLPRCVIIAIPRSLLSHHPSVTLPYSTHHVCCTDYDLRDEGAHRYAQGDAQCT
jgi:hypothetical protein